MKTLLTKLLAIGSIALLMLPSCKKDEKKVYATNVATSGLQASSTTLVLTKADLTKTAVTFNLTQADFGYSAAIKNVLQIDAPDDNFANPKEFNISGKVTTQAFTTLDFNNLVLALNLPTGVASPVQARIKSSISATVAPVYSNVVSLTVTPFALTAFVYVPGAYQGWNPAAADSLESATGNGVYTGVINFTGGDLNFKITSNRDWNHTNYGDAGGGTVSGSGGNLLAPAGGNIQINLDLNANTIVMTPVQWSIIGDATPGGWGGDTDMQFDNAHQMWVVTANLTAGGNIKFRLNHDWGTNLGGSDGTLSLNGANIPIAADGSYKITLDVNANTYTITKQ
ncbi:SusE domain-containing protein [Mucilaginibacter ginsenosidivorans]|uniref:SusF/SusE family outer membrane protein n=1 Tax=Mucilaginibacter ginsenosidivorans TaxID=398053 RepID=A0A5B8V1B0_9SPHI|nr:SusE domain-containing protein [Mucilaginibacter ginsenosidivorans]QEC64815.1 SusF/SusE family outer membrane protein [Mucilaginibacter ginsenosidivorans]